MTISRRTYLKSNATSDSTAPSSSKNSTLIHASTTGVSSAVLSASLVASSLMTDLSIESSWLSQATALQSYTTASGSLSFVYTTVPSAAFSPLYTMSSNASPQSFPSTYQNPSSFSPAPLLAAPISGPFHVPLNSSVMPKEGLISTPLIVLGLYAMKTQFLVKDLSPQLLKRWNSLRVGDACNKSFIFKGLCSENYILWGHRRELIAAKASTIDFSSQLDPMGDWERRGARALDNPRTATGEESLEWLLSLFSIWIRAEEGPRRS
nr:hypothetical protein [Tanacetum cinerariifolium]